MTYDQYRNIYLIGLIFCILMLCIAIILFIALKIPKVVGDLSGATARKAIKDIKKQAESNKDNSQDDVNHQRGRLTDKISGSGRLIKAETDRLGMRMATEKIGTQKLTVTSNETTVLNTGSSLDETTVLSAESGVTVVLDGMNETTVLNPQMSQSSNNIFVIEYEITFVHTNEIIPIC